MPPTQVVRMVMRHHEEQRQKEERAKREEQAKLRRVAAAIAKEVKQFWSNVEKVRTPPPPPPTRGCHPPTPMVATPPSPSAHHGSSRGFGVSLGFLDGFFIGWGPTGWPPPPGHPWVLGSMCLTHLPPPPGLLTPTR